MKCCQCGKQAIYEVQGHPFCVTCYAQVAQISRMQEESYEREMNFIAEQVEAVIGLPGTVPRYPVRRPVASIVQKGNTTLNNIRIDGSSIGILNTGSIQSINASITALNQSGSAQLGAAIRELIEAVIKEKSLDEAKRREAVEILSLVANETTLPKEQRRKLVMGPLITSLAGIVSGVEALNNLWIQYGPQIVAAFSP